MESSTEISRQAKTYFNPIRKRLLENGLERDKTAIPIDFPNKLPKNPLKSSSVSRIILKIPKNSVPSPLRLNSSREKLQKSAFKNLNKPKPCNFEYKNFDEFISLLQK